MLATLIALSVIASPRWPDDADQTLPCRPTIACTADIAAPGALELEIGYLFRDLRHTTPQTTLPFLLKLSLNDWFQLQVGSNGVTVQPPALFFDNLELVGKFHLVNQAAYIPAISVSAAPSLPTWLGQNGYLRTYDLLFIAYVTKDIGWLHADLNIGLNLLRIEHDPLTQPWTALALSANVGAGIGVMLEGYYFAPAAPISDKDAGLLTAISYAPRSWVVLDAGVDTSLFNARLFNLFVGATMILVDFWDTRAETARRESRSR